MLERITVENEENDEWMYSCIIYIKRIKIYLFFF